MQCVASDQGAALRLAGLPPVRPHREALAELGLDDAALRRYGVRLLKLGMLFPMEPPRTASFWMKNTLIPLDMIFIAADGTIRHIHSNAVPLSTDTIPSQFPVRGVLEINGGSAKLLGILVLPLWF